MAARSPSKKSSKQKVTIAEHERGERIDRVLAARTGLSRTRVKNLILDGAVTVGSRTIDDPATRVNLGDSVTVAVPPAEDPKPAGENIPLKVVYEDDEVIVIDKPAGLVVHPAAGHATGTL